MSNDHIKPIPIWPELPPGEVTSSRGRVIDQPGSTVTLMTDVIVAELFVYPIATNEPRPIIIVLPGGGYEILAIEHEGAEIATWLNSLGYVAAVLHYRVPHNRNGALEDAQRAVSVLRSRSKEFAIDPDCIGVLGFSAGGHLAIRLAVEGDRRAYSPIDAIDDSTCRPDLAMGIYPAYLIDRATGMPTEDVTPHTGMPPIFLAQTADDVHYCSSEYAEQLEKAGVNVQSVVYIVGGHGYGLRLEPDAPAAQWPVDAAAWLAKNDECAA